MNENDKNSLADSRRELLKMLDLEHLNSAELRLLSERRLDKKSMCWAVLHLSACRRCCSEAPELTAREIAGALTSTVYGDPDLIQQIFEYYS